MTCRVGLGVVRKQAVYGNSQSPFQILTDWEGLIHTIHTHFIQLEHLNPRAVVFLVRLL